MALRKQYIISILITLLLSTTVFSEARTALVIGNGGYSHFSRLTTPVNEARDMKNVLERLGFEVIIVLNGSKEQMLDAVYDFEYKLEQKGGLALFHYGGHGVQVDGKNYLIPANADIPDERRCKTRALDVEEVIAAMDASGSKTNIVILDACRDNPLPGGSRSGSRGLTVNSFQPPDSIIVYSAEAGSTAQDGLFTPTLIKYLERSSLDFIDVLRNVRTEVREKSGGTQRTGEYNQLESEIFLAGTGGSTPAVRTPGFQEEAIKYGSVKVSVIEAGSVYIDGTQMGTISANRSATLTDITEGRHEIEIRYSGNTEKKSVTVTENRTEQVTFSYRRVVETPRADENFIFVQGGTFQMGSNDGGSDEKPIHSVTLSSFQIGKYEVTQGEYKAVMGSNPSDTSKGIGDNYPVNDVSWYDAITFCNALSRKDGLTPAYNGSGDSIIVDMKSTGYRLPTEAEWEYAAKGGNNSSGYTYAGGNNMSNLGWYCDNSGSKTNQVGGKQSNELGVYDMSGNVWEWCWDRYGSYSSGSQTDPAGSSSGSSRVIRGGSWSNYAGYCRSAIRNYYNPSNGDFTLGFRLLRPAVQ